MSTVGHNSGVIACEELRLLVERVERLNEEMKDLQDDRKEVFAEAKARGYDPRTMREIIRIRKLEPHVYEERRSLLETYLAAFGVE